MRLGVEVEIVCALCRVPMTRVEFPDCRACARDGREGSLGHFRCENPECLLRRGGRSSTACFRIPKPKGEA